MMAEMRFESFSPGGGDRMGEWWRCVCGGGGA